MGKVRQQMDELYTAAVQLVAERCGMGLLEAWQATSNTHAFNRLLDESSGFYRKSPDELCGLFLEELGL